MLQSAAQPVAARGKISPLNSLASCLYISCSYVFSARSNRDDALGTCKLYNGGGFQTTECGDDTHDYAYITAPPTIHSPDTASTACATECPLSDGQQYKSKGGEVSITF